MCSTRTRAVEKRSILLVLFLCAVGGPSGAAALKPLDTLRLFLQADGRGDRLRSVNWHRVAPLISWSLEPAWDHVTLVRGTEVGTVRYDGSGAEIDVIYTVSGEIHAGAWRAQPRLETKRFLLLRDEASGMWKILGPPPVPHIFESGVDKDELAASLGPEKSTFLRY